jgi:hypothetical protein
MSNSEYQPRHTPLRPVTGILLQIHFSVLVLSLITRETLLHKQHSPQAASARAVFLFHRTRSVIHLHHLKVLDTLVFSFYLLHTTARLHDFYPHTKKLVSRLDSGS